MYMFLFNIQPLYNGIQQCMLRVHDYHFCPLTSIKSSDQEPHNGVIKWSRTVFCQSRFLILDAWKVHYIECEVHVWLLRFRVYQLYSSSESACTTVSFLSVHCCNDKWSGWFTVYTAMMISGVGGSVILNMEQFKFQQQSNCLHYGMYHNCFMSTEYS